MSSEMIRYKQAETEEEIHLILELQKQNLPKHLSENEKLEQGFLTVKHSFDLLWRMNTDFRHTLPTYKGQVIGYALSKTPKFAEAIPVLQSMFREINRTVKEKDFIVMGQICVAKPYRGRRIFRGLYHHMQAYTKNTFNSIITEVDIKNTRSMNAHKAIGFKELSWYEADERTWSLIQLK